MLAHRELEFHRDTQPKRTGTVEIGILIPTYARAPPKASEAPTMPSDALRRTLPHLFAYSAMSTPTMSRKRPRLTGLSVYLRAAGLLHGRQ